MEIMAAEKAAKTAVAAMEVAGKGSATTGEVRVVEVKAAATAVEAMVLSSAVVDVVVVTAAVARAVAVEADRERTHPRKIRTSPSPLGLGPCYCGRWLPRGPRGRCGSSGMGRAQT